MSKDVIQAATAGDRRWVALIVLCLGVLMIVLDTTVVNVALPSIRQDLKFTDTSLVWVVDAYMLTFGGFVLLCGRLGDLYGHRKLFLIGIVLFTIASLACGLANKPFLLIAARAVQGVGGAVVTAVALSLVIDMFTDGAERARAIGVFGFICASGGSIGLLLGGAITSALSWHWIFLVNLPIGVTVYALCLLFPPNIREQTRDDQLDVWGAVMVTMAFVLAVFAVVNGNEFGWTSAETLGLLTATAVFLFVLTIVEARVKAPLIPLGIFRRRNFMISNTIWVLWAAGTCTWFFVSAVYMQVVLGCGPMEVSLAFLPANVIVAVFSLGLSAKFVTRFGMRMPIVIGMLLGASGLALFARVPVNGRVIADVLPSMTLVGLGAGIVLNPLLLAAMSDIAPGESGLASGIVNTASLMGGSFGLALLAGLSAARTDELLTSGAAAVVALTGGYRVALLLGAICAGAAALLATFLRIDRGSTTSEYATIGTVARATAKD